VKDSLLLRGLRAGTWAMKRLWLVVSMADRCRATLLLLRWLAEKQLASSNGLRLNFKIFLKKGAKLGYKIGKNRRDQPKSFCVSSSYSGISGCGSAW
jgi:hypothetical protein